MKTQIDCPMKHHASTFTFILIILSVIVIGLITSCEKENPVDPKDYIGNWYYENNNPSVLLTMTLVINQMPITMLADVVFYEKQGVSNMLTLRTWNVNLNKDGSLYIEVKNELTQQMKILNITLTSNNSMKVIITNDTYIFTKR